MRFKGVRAVARAVLALACGALIVATLLVAPAGSAEADSPESHEPGLYLALGSPTQLMRGSQRSDGGIAFDPVGAPTGRSYNALAAHLADGALYAIEDASGDLIRVLGDGTTRTVMRLGAASVVGAFADSEHPDRMYYVPRGSKQLAWVDVATRERGRVSMTGSFVPVDFAWSRGYFWGLRIVDRRAVLTRLALDGRLQEAPVPGVDGTRFGGGSFGGAWTYGNGNLGFLANSGGAVQLRLATEDPAKAELVGYADSPASNNLDAALIPAAPVHLSVRFEASWGGPRTPMELAPVVRNDGATASSGYQLEFGPEGPDSRAVDSPAECVRSAGRFLCAGGTLRPGEERRHGFSLSMVSAGAQYAPKWVAVVQGNESDPSPVAAPESFPALKPTPVLIDTDVKARVVDARREGRVTVDKPVQVFVLVRNRSASPLSGIRVSIDSAPWKPQVIDEPLPPGELRTVRFDGRVDDLMIGGIAEISTTVTAEIDGARTRVQSKPLHLSGQGVLPNAGGLAGPQPDPVGNIDPLDPPPPFVIMPDDRTGNGAAAGSGTSAGTGTAAGSTGSAKGGSGGGSAGAGGASAGGAPPRTAAPGTAAAGDGDRGSDGTAIEVGPATGAAEGASGTGNGSWPAELSATGSDAPSRSTTVWAAVILLLGGAWVVGTARQGGRRSRA
ncbi:hypothetical protein BMH32_06495 [Leucobacter sp. OLJS4]|uniref:DUF6923 family protein n=2 Tax=Leucobacter TaxID=55968 RepID=UPI000C174725|nr:MULTISPECIES: hypothetical protein [unclassified Leucobacter]PII83681.1 hypothetical protein BMH25_06070 [Leucobacter sp. OLCALW19]PII87038.1 hypothetical protein BMH26_12160 [Leucobacter sp. OLTLW20]PII89494.1 hypothetical protein BMH27_14185 [Leucobacter sp. OLAS13]PII97933.1 hypothetical protein BMH29_10215 [Leucobacter sp. OLDS2]PIJ01463.1 hypothetical protein BMH31_14415 [Leucobacter sp. OLIS6]